MAKHTLTIEKLVYGGAGLARVEGRVFMAPYVLPGEEVVIRDGKPVKLHEVLTPSPLRVEAKCPIFGWCGGCDYQHMDYAEQLRQKPAILRETLARIGRLTPPDEIDVVAGDPWGYRNRVQLHSTPDGIGFYAAGSHSVVPAEECPISSPAINAALRQLRGMRKERPWPGFLRSIELFSNETETMVNVLETQKPLSKSFFEWCASRIPGADGSEQMHRAAGFDFRVGHASFFQVNRLLLDELIGLAAQDDGGATAWDLYAGVGLFSVPLSRKFERVTSVENIAGAVRDLEFNAPAVKAVRSGVEPFLAAQTETPDFVLADPPRMGLGKTVTTELVRLRPRRLTVVSCDPATLARDLRALIDGGYEVAEMTMIDLFPQTFHIETVTRLRLA